jgi:hypothetical protein
MTDDPTQLERYYALKMRIIEMAAEMGLDMNHYSILLETEDPKLALVFTVQPEAFTKSDIELEDTDSTFEEMIANMYAEPEPSDTKSDADQLKEFLDGDFGFN